MNQSEFELALNQLVVAGIAISEARDTHSRREAHAEFETIREQVVNAFAQGTTATPEANPFKPKPVIEPKPVSGTTGKRKRGKCADCGKGCGSFYRCANCHAKHKSKL